METKLADFVKLEEIDYGNSLFGKGAELYKKNDIFCIRFWESTYDKWSTTSNSNCIFGNEKEIRKKFASFSDEAIKYSIENNTCAGGF